MGKYIKTVSIVNILLLIILSITNESFAARKPNWWYQLQELQILESHRSDVEKRFKLSEPRHQRKFGEYTEIEYETREGILLVGYTLGKCLPESNGRGANIEKDILVFIDFTANKPVKLSSLKIDLTAFTSEQEHDSNVFYYTNRDLGIEYTIRNKKLENVSLSIPKKKEHLRCKH